MSETPRTQPPTVEPARAPARRALAVAAAALLGFTLVLLAVELHWTRAWDVHAEDRLNRLVAHRPGLVDFWKAVSLLGQPIVFETLAVPAAVALWRRDRRAAVFVPVSVLGAALLYTVVKVVVGRARPSVAVVVTHAHGMSFPSGHAMASWAAVAALVIVTRGRARRTSVAVGLVVALTIAASRLALGVHYPTDILAGWLLGTAWVALTAAATGAGARQPISVASRAASFGSAST